jgi:hypothetical protein
MNCKNCKHWSEDTLAGIPPEGFRECRMARGELPNSAKAPKALGYHPRTLMRATPVETGEAMLFTTADFGCVHWDGAA